MYEIIIFSHNNSGEEIMRNTKYEKIADFHKVKETRGKNALIAFLSGGVIGLCGEIIIELLCNDSNLYFLSKFINCFRMF